MQAYICCPSLVVLRCVLAILCKWSRRVLAGEGGARGVEGVSPCPAAPAVLQGGGRGVWGSHQGWGCSWGAGIGEALAEPLPGVMEVRIPA